MSCTLAIKELPHSLSRKIEDAAPYMWCDSCSAMSHTETDTKSIGPPLLPACLIKLGVSRLLS